MSTLPPRVVVVHRRTELDDLLARHATEGQAEFYLAARGRGLADVRPQHERQAVALQAVSAAIPADWRRAGVERTDLDRFAFAPDDLIVAVGQDGLVANVAKYLAGQPVVGVDPSGTGGPLVRHAAAATADLLADVVAGRASVQSRTMVEAVTDTGERLSALNEVFVGHVSHQSARYRLAVPGQEPRRQSSSGLIVGTGTGATGWCASLTSDPAQLPTAQDGWLAWFVREAWPGQDTSLVRGRLTGQPRQSLQVNVEAEGMVVFGDGIESDHLALAWGQRVNVGVASGALALVT